MRGIKIIILLVGFLMGFEGFGQEVSDSVAICPPGSPAEEMGPEPNPDNMSRLMTVEEIAIATDTIIANYDSAWEQLSMQGKLSFDGLPMSVSVKLYMKRGESIILSGRAPFFGEVARVEVNQDSIVFINKHTRTYNVQPFGSLNVDAKAYLCDFQDILLGQVAFPGNGRLTAENAGMSQWIALPTEQALIYPSADLQVPGTEYGFVMDSALWQMQSFVLMLRQVGIVVETKYQYGDKGWTLGIEVSMPKKKMNGEAQLSYPDYDPTPMEFTKIGSKYRKVDFKNLLKF